MKSNAENLNGADDGCRIILENQTLAAPQPPKPRIDYIAKPGTRPSA